MFNISNLSIDLPPPSTRERPPGCKTVFVGGLPENATEEIIQEVFEQCGDITAIRKSKKNFCHIRFAEEFMVDKAIYLSGTVNSNFSHFPLAVISFCIVRSFCPLTTLSCFIHDCGTMLSSYKNSLLYHPSHFPKFRIYI